MINSMNHLIKKRKIKFPSADWDEVFKIKKGVLIDIDDTLYPYWPSHINALNQTLLYLKKRYPQFFKNLSLDQFNEAYQKHRKIVIERLYPNGMCRNRYILFLSWMESLNIKRAYILAQRLESIYWKSFIENIKPDPKAMKFLNYCYQHSIKVVALTDMQADIQIKKLKRLKMDRLISYLVTSDEAGKEKPFKNIFRLSLKKLGFKASQVIMIGDNDKKDLEGAAAIGIDGYKVE